MNSDPRPPAERVGPGLWSIPVPIPWNPLGRFTGHTSRAREIAAHHQARLAEVEFALAPAGATLWEVAAQMEWNQPWSEMSPASHRMALSEAAAHLRYLERRQQVRVLRPEGPVRYELSVDPSAVTPRRPA